MIWCNESSSSCRPLHFNSIKVSSVLLRSERHQEQSREGGCFGILHQPPSLTWHRSLDLDWTVISWLDKWNGDVVCILWTRGAHKKWLKTGLRFFLLLLDRYCVYPLSDDIRETCLSSGKVVCVWARELKALKPEYPAVGSVWLEETCETRVPKLTRLSYANRNL